MSFTTTPQGRPQANPLRVIDGAASDPLVPRVPLDSPRPLRFCAPILLDGDLVMSPEHLGPAYLVSVLRNAGATCQIVEVPISGDDTTFAQSIASWEPDIVGLSLTTINIEQAIAFGSILRDQLATRGFILAGGPLATHLGRDLMNNPNWSFLDGLVRGEGEVPILRLAEAIHSASSLEDVPNLVYRCPQSGEVCECPMAPGLTRLEALPRPARDQLVQHRGKLPYVRISTSRGCVAHCTFCNAPHTRNRVVPGLKAWRGENAPRVVDEIESIYRTHHANTFDFVDSTFEDPGGGRVGKQRIRDIANEILRRKLKIYFNVCMQAYNWDESDQELLRLLWESGLEKVLVGIESGSEKGLRRWQKRASLEDNVRIIRMLRDVGAYVAFGFISYHPWIDFAEIRENYDFLRRFMGYNLRRYTVRLEVYPGAEVVQDLYADGLMEPHYAETLNPFAYRYVDPRIGKLAFVLNNLYGEEYAAKCTIDDEPSVFQFETYDIVLHTYYSRLLRHFGDQARSREILDGFAGQVAATKDEMAAFNYDLMSRFVDAAEQDRLDEIDVPQASAQIERYFSARIAHLRSLQLKTSMKLYRAGIHLGEIQRSIA